MSKKYTGISPLSYVVSLFIVSVATLMITMWIDRNIYDWPAIHAKLERLEELETNAAMYEYMIDFNLGVWCGLSVHYDWLDDEDKASIQRIIESEVHE